MAKNQQNQFEEKCCVAFVSIVVYGMVNGFRIACSGEQMGKI